MYRLDGVPRRVADGHLAQVKRHHKGCGDFHIPSVKFQRLVDMPLLGLQIGRKTGCRYDVRQISYFLRRERHYANVGGNDRGCRRSDGLSLSS